MQKFDPARLYLPEGWLDWDFIYNLPFDHIILWGGRGTGKTYGLLKYLYETNRFSTYMRRTDKIAARMGSMSLHPYRKINHDLGTNVLPIKIDNFTMFYDAKYLPGKKQPVPVDRDKPRAILTALSTLSGFRGIDLYDLHTIYYDEFIPEPSEKKIKDEGTTLLNAVETLRRNAELEGRNPAKLICTSNANYIDNPVFVSLGIVDYALKMQREHLEILPLPKRDAVLIKPNSDRIMEQKKQTALYKLTEGTEFYSMAVENIFVNEDEHPTISRDLRGYTAVCAIGQGRGTICIYKSKATEKYYVCSHVSGSPEKFGAGDSELARAHAYCCYIIGAYMRRDVEFEKRIDEVLFCKYLGV